MRLTVIAVVHVCSAILIEKITVRAFRHDPPRFISIYSPKCSYSCRAIALNIVCTPILSHYILYLIVLSGSKTVVETPPYAPICRDLPHERRDASCHRPLPWQTNSILINAKISFQVPRFASIIQRLSAGTFCHEKWLKW